MMTQDVTPAGGFQILIERLDRIEAAVVAIAERQTVKDWYSTDEVAKILGKSEFTVREWCRHGRIKAEKRHSGRGAHPAWVISQDELKRYQREGLLVPRREQR